MRGKEDVEKVRQDQQDKFPGEGWDARKGEGGGEKLHSSAITIFLTNRQPCT